MKILLILAVVLVGVWLWKNRRGPVEVNRSTAVAQPQEMVRCSHCGVHLPTRDAITGPQGSYCCADHRQQSES